MHKDLQYGEQKGSAYAEFGVVTAGFVLAITGVVLSSVGVAFVGLALIGAGLGYFAMARDRSD